MGRRATNRPVELTIEPGIPEGHALTLAEERRLGAIENRLTQIDETWGDGQPFNVERLVRQVHRSGEAIGAEIFEIGRAVVWIKERLPHGEYLHAIAQMDIGHTFARQCAQAVLRLAGPNCRAPGNLAALGRTKLLELTYLDDDQLKELNEEQTVAGLTLDEVDRLSTRELRAKLRKEREERSKEKEVNERLLGDKNRKIDELDAKLGHRETAPDAEQEQAIVADIWAAVQALGAPLLRLEQQLAATHEHRAESITGAVHLACGQSIAFLMQQLADMAVRRECETDPATRVVPPFVERVNELIRREYIERAQAEQETVQTH